MVRASDDPVAAAQASTLAHPHHPYPDRATRLEVQRNAMVQAESSLGDAITLVQDIRQLVVNAGNGANTPADRRTVANQILSLRESNC